MSGGTTTVNATYDRAVKIDADLLTRLDASIHGFFKTVKIRILADTPYGIEDIPDSAEAIARAKKADEERDYSARRLLENIADKLKLAETTSWFVVLSDSTTIADASIGQILELSNSSSERITSLAIRSGGYGDYRVTIGVTDRHRSCVDFSCKADLADTRQLKREIISLLENATRPWWLLRRGVVVWSAWIVVMFGMNIGTILSGLSALKSESNTIGGDQMLGVVQVAAGGAVLVLLASFLLMYLVTRAWEWVFPKVEFTWGGGRALFEARNRVRSLVFWTIPVTLVGSALLGAVAGKLIS